ncbi:MAG: hypothetical protein V1866_01365 [archaeon]
MKPLEAPRTIEGILYDNWANTNKFLEQMRFYVQANISSPSALAEMDFSENQSAMKMRLGKIANALVNETLGKRRPEFSESEYKLASFIELMTLLFGGLKERKMGMIEQNHPSSTAYNIMLKGGSKIEFYAAMLHDFVENKAENDTGRVNGILNLHKTLNRFVDLQTAEEERKSLKAGNTKIAIIIDLLTQKREVRYGDKISEEHYDDFIGRITRLPREKETLKLYKRLGLFEQVEGKHTADEMINFIYKWGWDEKSYGSIWLSEKSTLAGQVQRLKRFFTEEITLPAMNIKLEDRRDNTIKVYAFRSRNKSLTPAKQNRSNNAKNLIDTIPLFKRYLESIKDEEFDTRLTYRLMEDLRATTAAQIDKTIKESIFSNNPPTAERYLRMRMRDFKIATFLYERSGGFNKSTKSGETKMPLYIPDKLVSNRIRKDFQDLDNITSEYVAYDRKLKQKPYAERKDKSLQHLIAFKKLAYLLKKGLMPNYHQAHE